MTMRMYAIFGITSLFLFIIHCTQPIDDRVDQTSETEVMPEQNDELTYTNIREPIRAGISYSEDAEELQSQIENLLSNSKKIVGGNAPWGLIAPHYIRYSSQVTAEAFKQLEGFSYNRVILISNVHGAPSFYGIEIDSFDAWRTPLGLVEVDKSFADSIVKSDPLISLSSTHHVTDFTLENLLPYLQVVLNNNFKIVPVCIGNSFYIGQSNYSDYKRLSDALLEFIDEGDLVVVSNDMSHNFSDAECETIDLQMIDVIKESCIDKIQDFEQQVQEQYNTSGKILCCSIDGIKVIVDIDHRKKNGNIEMLSRGIDANVGYASMVFY